MAGAEQPVMARNRAASGRHSLREKLRQTSEEKIAWPERLNRTEFATWAETHACKSSLGMQFRGNIGSKLGTVKDFTSHVQENLTREFIVVKYVDSVKRIRTKRQNLLWK